MSEEKDKGEYLKELVLARLDVMPSNYKLSVGNQGTFTKMQLMDSVRRESSLGKQIIGMQVNFIKALTSGELTKVIAQ